MTASVFEHADPLHDLQEHRDLGHGHRTSSRTTTNTPPGYDAPDGRAESGSGLQRERQHAVVARGSLVTTRPRRSSRARARRPGGACPRAPRTRSTRSSGCGPTLSICSTKRSHCFSKPCRRSRISCDVRLSWKLSTAWRITASTANSVSGEQNTTLCAQRVVEDGTVLLLDERVHLLVRDEEQHAVDGAGRRGRRRRGA